MSTPAPEPFDDQAYLRLLDYVDGFSAAGGTLAAPDVGRLTHLGRKLMEEVIRLRQAERDSRQRASLLEQGQQVLPFPLPEERNTAPAPGPHLSTATDPLTHKPSHA